jgi:DNA modification methylase
MTDYQKFLESKQKKVIQSGFYIEESELNPMLFDFQKFTVKRALKAGKYAVFADTGQGKTPMQLEIAKQVNKFTKKPALILSPLAVSGQTIEEGIKFNIEINRLEPNKFCPDQGIWISNYEQLDNIDISNYNCICLDESSILKNETGKYRNLIIEKFKDIPYKFCFSATPSPNDPMELGNHSEFLDAMKYNEMLAMFFVHDSSETQKWRLKGHAIKRFYEFVSTWSIMFSHPKDIGFKQNGYDLPELKIIEKIVKTPLPEGQLFPGKAVNATDYHKSLRETQQLRIDETIKIIKSISKTEQIIIWTNQNQEAESIYKQLANLGYNCRNVQGSDSYEKKEKDLLGFAHNDFQILISKEKIAGMGMNYQKCGIQIFNSIDFSFEQVYQALRRSWRFGRKEKVIAYMITTDRMINVSKIQQDKQKKFKTMQQEMINAVDRNINNRLLVNSDNSEDVKNDKYWLLKGDCVQRIKEVNNDSADIIIFSPPFADLYTYSNSIEDMGNVSDYDEFKEHFKYLIPELRRVIKPGRLICVHSMNLPILKSQDGYIGLRRFNSLIGDLFEENDMFLHSEFSIWKDPLLAAVRTKTKGLAHQTLLKDSSEVRTGIFDLIQCFKTKEENEVPIEHDLLTSYIPMHEFDNFPRTINGFNDFWGFDPKSKYTRQEQYSHHIWQRYASPVWLDIKSSDVLQYTIARDQNDEKHICPLQLPVIDRLLTLYSKEGETLLSPFGGIGSEGYQALKRNRKSISIELKESYFNINIKNHRNAIDQNRQLELF